MEDSLNSSANKVVSSKRGADCPEESGWTVYFEDFLSNNRDNSSCSSGFESSYLVSDAASCVAWKFSDHDRVDEYPSVVRPEHSCKKLSFKKRRTRGVLDEDALEDTASSPVNSPKVSDSKQLDMNPRNKDDNIENSDQKGSTSDHCSEPQRDERNDELGCTGRENECTELKKRGLCLVPISMLMNYLR